MEYACRKLVDCGVVTYEELAVKFRHVAAIVRYRYATRSRGFICHIGGGGV